MTTVDQPTAKPTRKVTFAAIAGFLVTLASAIVQAASSFHFPSWAVGAAVVIVATGTAYGVRERQA